MWIYTTSPSDFPSDKQTKSFKHHQVPVFYITLAIYMKTEICNTK